MGVNWHDMTPRERDARIHHRIFGEHIEHGPIPCPDGRLGCLVAHQGYTSEGAPVPHYTTNPAACRLVEDEIERRGLKAQYIAALANDVLGLYLDIFTSAIERGRPDALNMHDVLWLLVTATPEQRCRAAWLVIEEPSHAR